MKSSAFRLAALLLLFASALDARAKTKRAKRSGRRSNTGDNSGGTSSYEYDASDCNGSWDVGSDEELQLGLPDDRCDFEEVSEADFNRHVFMQRFSLRRPLIVRQSSVNERAREMISSRCEMLRRYGALPVELGDPFSLAKHGRSTRRMTLGEYLETAFQEDAPLYFFDRSGQWSKSMRELSELVSAPDSIFLRPQPESSQIIFAMGKTGSGIGLHQHQDAFNQVLLGRKRWTVYPGNPGGIPPAAGYNPSLPHRTWLRTVYPLLPADSKPLECIQGLGDIVYVPSGWHHATINIGDTAAIAMQAAAYPSESARFLATESKAAIVAASHVGDDVGMKQGLALAREAVQLDPTEGDHRQILAHALQMMGMGSEAHQHLHAAVELMPNNPTSYIAAGAVMNDQKRWAEAVDMLHKGKAALVKSGSAQESAQAAAISEQLESAERELAKARRRTRGGS